MKLEYSVHYSITITANDRIIVEELCKANKLANACAFLMQTYQISLHDANCIRKLISQGTYVFDCNLDSPTRN